MQNKLEPLANALAEYVREVAKEATGKTDITPEEVAKEISVGDIANEISLCDVAQEIDLSDLAAEVDISGMEEQIANNLNYSEVGNAVWERNEEAIIETVIEKLDYKMLANALIESLAEAYGEKMKEREVANA